MTPELSQALQSLNPGDAVHLFELDLNPIGVASIERFSPTNLDGVSAIVWDGNTYAYAPIAVTGVEWSANGDPPDPKLMLPNGTKYVSGLVITYDDLVGARLTRIRTFKQFLDGQALEDPDAVQSRDVFQIYQKLNLNRIMGEFAIRPIYSLDGKKIPNRVCMKDVCPLRYRTHNGVAFDYSRATCPYTGTNYFTDSGASTAAANDVCGKRLQDCVNRFGTAVDLPYGGFPGMSRIRV